MSALMEILGQSLDAQAMDQIGSQLGVDRGTAQNAVGVALPVIVGALSRHAASPAGQTSLQAALGQHDGSLLDDLSSVLGPGAASGMGASILSHVLGGRQDATAASVGRASGLDAGQGAQLLAMLAPIVMAALSRAQQQSPSADVGDVLGAAQSHLQQASPGGMGLVAQMLDSNHDGNVSDDVARMGIGLLGSLFGQRR
jgi:hypothetical protein